MVWLAACLLAEIQVNPTGKATSRIGLLMTILRKMGLSPFDRVGIEIPSHGDDDES